jgi:hypothetical protein
VTCLGLLDPCQSQPIIDKTQNDSARTGPVAVSLGERRAVDKLLEVGLIFEAFMKNSDTRRHFPR